MQKLNLYLFVLLLPLVFDAAAQSGVYLELRAGAGTFGMKSMKELQQQAVHTSGIDAKTTDTFGPYVQFGANVLKDLNENTRAGIFVEHGSTGGRVSYRDYSGEILIDDLMSYNAVGGMLYSHYAIRESKLHFFSGMELNAFFSKLVHKEYWRIYTESAESEDTFKAIGVGIKPFVGLQYPVVHLPLRLSVGYMASASAPFHEPGKPKNKLTRNADGKSLEPGWSGLRLNLSVAFPLFGKDGKHSGVK
ncbi:hypothetical protein MKJ04_18040 [Pontibacter sp. E15-1]|uniref:hypothetical protein n=1 Tax=Pontibacter sp. E15-1 TaxID=2919918 RepID=UPI001F500C23|nr:hypothetical protein [Pontibacter sp. E15-1]MCJ8166753.1 hypothetical protein [Pontibacter sp. E15-1]